VGGLTDSTAGPSRERRAITAAALGICVTALVWVGQAPPGSIATDWLNIWVGAHAMIHGQSPYRAAEEAFQAGRLVAPLYYPATATALTAPLGLLSPRLSGALWSGSGLALLAFVLTRRGWWGLAALASVPVVGAVLLGQWSPWLSAAAGLPALTLVWVAKPNIGLAMFAGWPSRRAVIGAALLVLVSVAVAPTWPREWLSTVSEAPQYLSPLFRPGGILLLFAWLRWRLPEARMLGALSIVPHTTNLYEMVPLFLIPRRPVELGVLVIGTYVAQMLTHVPASVGGGRPEAAAAFLAANWPVYLACCYLPSLIMVLRRSSPRPIPEQYTQSAADERSQGPRLG
jgi:hypothetical protein